MRGLRCGGFIISGKIIANGGNITFNNANIINISDGGQLIVQNGGTLNIDGDVRFSIGGLLKAHNNAQYVFVDSVSVSGLQQGAVDLTDARGLWQFLYGRRLYPA